MGNFKKIIRGDELYLYNGKGELIYKRWLKRNTSVVFDVMPYGKDTLISITDNNTIKND
jgi:hypothetical protein